jgi:hypothetical protein
MVVARYDRHGLIGAGLALEQRGFLPAAEGRAEPDRAVDALAIRRFAPSPSYARSTRAA